MTDNTVNRRNFLKTSSLGVGLGVGATVGTAQPLSAQPSNKPEIPKRDGIEFLDHRTVEHTYFLDRKITPVQKPSQLPVLADCHSAQTVLKDKSGRLRMWYLTRRKIPGYKGSAREYTVRYAESTDGLAWDLPNLGLKELDGNKQNNALFTANDVDMTGRKVCGQGGMDGFCVIDNELTPTPHARGRYTAMFHPYEGLCMAHSDDGLRWTAYPENPVFKPRGSDTYNNFLFDTGIGRFVLYHRPHPNIHAGVRSVNRLVARVESDDLLHWDNARCVLDTDARDAQGYSEVRNARGRDVQFYGMSVAQHQDFYLGTANLLNEITGHMDVRLVYSFDGIDWHREPVEEPFIPISPNSWDCGNIGFVSASCPVPMGDDLHFYYGATNMTHNYKIMNEEKTLKMRLGLGTVKKGRLAGYHAGKAKGQLLTRPFLLDKPQITLNVDIFQEGTPGEIKAALLAEDGAPHAGFTIKEAAAIRQGGLQVQLKWQDKSNLAEFVGKKVRLRIDARNAALYGVG